jgi:hypothetical protein
MIEVGKNSYVTIDEATTYLSSMLDANEWTSADNETKEKALISATRNIDREKLNGKKYSDDQVLQFPRLADGENIPQVVKDACCEEALFLLKMTAYQKKREMEHALGMVGASIGDASEYAQQSIVQQKTKGRGVYSPIAKQLLKPYTTLKGAYIV